jgi:hypothetical protein
VYDAKTQEELYPMSTLGGKVTKQDIRVDTKIVVKGEDSRKLPRTGLRKGF